LTTRYATLLMDTASRLAEAETPRDTWEAAVAVGHRIGATAMTCGAVMRGSRRVAWVRSSMTPAFLDAFSAEQLYEVDPIQSGAIAGRVRPRMDIAACLAAERDPRARDLYALLLDHGYRHYVNHTWTEGESEHTLALTCDRHPDDLYGPGTAKAFRAVSALVSAAMSPHGLSDLHDRSFDAPWSRLSSAERDLLCYFGQGLTPEQIADRLARPLDHVAQLLTRACETLGTPRPEQALALMLVRGGMAL